MGRCRVVTGKVNTGSTYVGDGDWIEHYANSYCTAELVRGKCPVHSRKKPAARSALKKSKPRPSQEGSGKP